MNDVPAKPTPEETQRREYRAAHAAATETRELIEPTAEEARNGWTAETLTEYLTDQKAAQTVRIDPTSAMRRAARPVRANSKYKPLRWRG